VQPVSAWISPQGGELVESPHLDGLEAQIGAPARHHRAGAAGQHRPRDPAGPQHHQAQPVARVEDLERLALGGVVQGAVGHDPVAVDDQQPDGGQPVGQRAADPGLTARR
jgi:hypothetical protein